MKRTQLTGVAAAIRALDAHGVKGTPTELSRRSGFSRTSLHNWERSGIPLRRLARMKEVTGLPMRTLRPDYELAFVREMGITAKAFFRQHKTKIAA